MKSMGFNSLAAAASRAYRSKVNNNVLFILELEDLNTLVSPLDWSNIRTMTTQNHSIHLIFTPWVVTSVITSYGVNIE